jgi:hypothetical protein
MGGPWISLHAARGSARKARQATNVVDSVSVLQESSSEVSKHNPRGEKGGRNC